MYIHMQISPFIDFSYTKNGCFSDVDILRNTYIILIYTYDLQAIMLHYVQNNCYMLLL